MIARVSIDTSELRALKARISNIRTEQIPYSLSRALNDTARAVQTSIKDVLTKEIDKPKPFTVSAPTYMTPATKTEPVAEVGLKDLQARYLGPMVRGGMRQQKVVEQKFMGRFFVPSRIMPKDAYGNVSKANLLALLKAAGERDGAWKGRRVIVSTSKAMPFAPGVYWGNKVRGRGKGKLEPLLLFVDAPPKYRKRIDIKAAAQATVRAQFPDLFLAAYRRAVETAR